MSEIHEFMDFAILYMNLNSMQLVYEVLWVNEIVFVESGWVLVEGFFSGGFTIVWIRIIFRVIVSIFL